MKVPSDQAARDRIRTDLDTTLVVEAAAGTGKTTQLVQRVMSLLLQGRATLARLVAVTFTEKAAGEMKLRLRTEIEKARRRATADERRRLDLALEELEEAHIGTIHGFCAELLRQRPVEARVDPLFEAADEDQQARIFDEAFARWFEEALARPPDGVRRVLRHKPRGWDRTGPRELLRRAGIALVGVRDYEAPWRRDPFDQKSTLDEVMVHIEDLAAVARRLEIRDDWAAKSLVEVRRFHEEVARREAIRGRDYDGLEEELRGLARQKFWGWKGRARWMAKGLSREEVLAKRQETKDVLTRALAQADADLAACLLADLRPLVRAYRERMTLAGKLDFLDLLLIVRNLVRDDAAVRKELQERFSHLLVDEFQDTDPLQAEILLLLAADDPTVTDFTKAHPVSGKLFVVGDPKQSIYRFRRADVALYEATKRRLLDGGAALVHLSTSFRSAPSIQTFVNEAFAPRMQGSADGSQADYVALEPFRDDPEGQPTIVALPVPRPYTDYGKVAGYQIDKSLPDAVGAFVDWLIRKSGWTVTERERPTERVPIEARHICLLTRRFLSAGQDLTRGYVRALEARRIPHVLVGGRSFHAREEVVALRNALSAVEWPDDELSVFATLHGPLFAIGDDALLVYRQLFGGLHPMRPADPARLTALTRVVEEALEVLRRLHRRRNRRPIADTAAELLDTTRAHAGIAIWPTGEQALANVLRVVDQARRFEAAGATSFRAFVQWLDQEADRGNAAEAPVVEEGTDGVRIMTVYKAKGLEFPVVILIDPTCPHVLQEPSRFVDGERGLWAMPLAGCTPAELAEHREEILRHDADEAVRLTYVAATRARELLVVPVVGDDPTPGWVDLLHPVLYPQITDRRHPREARGCPAFGFDTVLEGPSQRDPEDGVRPGLHLPRAGTQPVVWWDPRALELDKTEEAGLRQQRILAADATGTTAAESERAHAEWELRRNALLAAGARASLVVHRVTDGDVIPSDARPIAVEATSAVGAPRPHGARFGSLVHAVLSTIALDAQEVAVFAAAEAAGRMLGAPRVEISAAQRCVVAALEHPLLRAARGAGARCRRESPVVLATRVGVVEGVLDLAFREDADGKAAWVVVDYKTDAELEGRRDEYEAQVRLYVDAVEKATGEPARGVLLRV